MTGVEQPQGLPRIELAVRRGSGRYRRHLDLSGEDAAAVDLPGIRSGGKVRIDVADGINPADLAVVTAFAVSVRGAAVVQIIGCSRGAVEAARRVFLNAWRLDVDTATPVRPEEASAVRWARLLLGIAREEGGQR